MKGTFILVLLVIITGMLGCDNEGDFQFDDINVSSAGSMAQFHIDQTVLYVVEQNNLTIFDIANNDQPIELSKTGFGWQAETIFKINEVLMIGTTTGVLFYDVSNPAIPLKLSGYAHVTSCDPVVSNGQYAFVTLRAGRNCGLADNVLQILDITDIENPVLVSSYPMVSPYGLALMGNNLFVGEGNNGMKWFDVSNTLEIKLLTSFDDIKALDFIAKENNLTIATTNSLLQMNLTPTNDLVQISEMFYAGN